MSGRVSKMKLVAHKGYSTKFPDNTPEAYREALKFNPEGIEMDIVFFEDEFYLYHPKQNRIIYGMDTDTVIEKEMKQMKEEGKLPEKLELDGLCVELLKDVEFLILDIKQKVLSVVPEIIYRVVDSAVEPGQIILGARDRTRMIVLDGHYDKYDVLALDADPDTYEEYIEKGAKYIRLWESDVTEERINAIHELGAQVLVNPGDPPSPTQKSTSGETIPEALLKFDEMGVDLVLVNDIEMARGTIK